MHIEWVWDTDRAPDPVHVADFFLTSVVVIAVLFFLASQLLVLLRRNTASVRARRWWSLELMIIGSVTHIVAEWVSNAHVGHATWFDSVRTFHCTFWDYWFKYGLGFNLWQVGQAGRLFAWFVTLEMKTANVPALAGDALQVVGADGTSHLGVDDASSGATTQLISTKVSRSVSEQDSGLQSEAIQSFSVGGGAVEGAMGAVRSTPYVPRLCECTWIRNAWHSLCVALHKRRFGILLLATCIAFGLPGLLLCGAVELTHSIEYSAVYRWCVTHSGFVYITVGWLLACVMVLLLLLLRMRKYNTRESTSYCATRDSTYIGLVFLVILVVANRFEVSVTWWGRVLQTSLVMALYVFSYLRLNWGMFRDAYRYGLSDENPMSQETTLSDIECVLSGEDKEPTFASIMRTVKSRTQFIHLLRELPLWVLPSTFSSAMDQDQLTTQFAARCHAKFYPDGRMHVEKPGTRRLRLKDNDDLTHQFSVDDNELDAPSHAADTSSSATNTSGNGYRALRQNHHFDMHNYHFAAPSDSAVQDHNGLMLDISSADDFKHVSLHDALPGSNMMDVIQNAQTSTVEVCPADVWLLYVAYSNYRQLIDESRMDEAVLAMRDILSMHFPLAEPPVERILLSDPASVQKDNNETGSKSKDNKDIAQNSSSSAAVPSIGSAGLVAAAATGFVFSRPTTNSSSTAGIVPTPLATIASRSIVISDDQYEQSTINESGTAALLLDRKCQSTTRIFAQFFQINRPQGAVSNAPFGEDSGVEVLQHGGIHTLPLTNTHLRAAYVAAAQCNDDMDMHDPLYSVGWMCEFLLSKVWLPWCIHRIPNFYRMYKTERRTMAMFVAMDDGLASRPQRVRVTSV